jgi:hypothetical protein
MWTSRPRSDKPPEFIPKSGKCAKFVTSLVQKLFIFFQFFFQQLEVVATLTQFRFSVINQFMTINLVGVVQDLIGFFSDDPIFVS